MSPWLNNVYSALANTLDKIKDTLWAPLPPKPQSLNDIPELLSYGLQVYNRVQRIINTARDISALYQLQLAIIIDPELPPYGWYVQRVAWLIPPEKQILKWQDIKNLLKALKDTIKDIGRVLVQRTKERIRRELGKSMPVPDRLLSQSTPIVWLGWEYGVEYSPERAAQGLAEQKAKREANKAIVKAARTAFINALIKDIDSGNARLLPKMKTLAGTQAIELFKRKKLYKVHVRGYPRDDVNMPTRQYVMFDGKTKVSASDSRRRAMINTMGLKSPDGSKELAHLLTPATNDVIYRLFSFYGTQALSDVPNKIDISSSSVITDAVRKVIAYYQANPYIARVMSREDISYGGYLMVSLDPFSMLVPPLPDVFSIDVSGTRISVYQDWLPVIAFSMPQIEARKANIDIEGVFSGEVNAGFNLHRSGANISLELLDTNDNILSQYFLQYMKYCTVSGFGRPAYDVAFILDVIQLDLSFSIVDLASLIVGVVDIDLPQPSVESGSAFTENKIKITFNVIGSIVYDNLQIGGLGETFTASGMTDSVKEAYDYAWSAPITISSERFINTYIRKEGGNILSFKPRFQPTHKKVVVNPDRMRPFTP
ncbi:MAG: hypothetical protein QW815_07205 [Nitrososphaerota archaeon]